MVIDTGKYILKVLTLSVAWGSFFDGIMAMLNKSPTEIDTRRMRDVFTFVELPSHTNG